MRPRLHLRQNQPDSSWKQTDSCPKTTENGQMILPQSKNKQVDNITIVVQVVFQGKECFVKEKDLQGNHICHHYRHRHHSYHHYCHHHYPPGYCLIHLGSYPKMPKTNAAV